MDGQPRSLELLNACNVMDTTRSPCMRAGRQAGRQASILRTYREDEALGRCALAGTERVYAV